MDLSIIIVSWNVLEKLEANLRALFESQGAFKFEVIVVDNNSKDNSCLMVKNKFSQVALIENSENLGFSKANNQAIKISKGEYILLLNPDMKVSPDTLEKALFFAQKNQIATVSGCKLKNERGELVKQIRRFPKFIDQLLIILKVPHILPAVLNNYLCSNFNYEVAAKVDSIRGAFFLINKNNFQKISGRDKPFLDERYFIWFEEVDFCREVYKLGGEVWYNPEAECLDYVGASFSQVKRGLTQEYFQDSMLKYFKKWESKRKYIILKIAWSIVRFFI